MSRRKWILTGLAGAALLAGSAVQVQAQPVPVRPPAPAAPATPPAPPPPPAPAAGKPPAVVNGEVISKADLDLALKQVGMTAVQMPEDQRRARQMEVLGLLIDHELMRQFLAKNAPAVAPAEVSARLATMEAELKKQNKSLQDFYRETSQTEAVLRGDIAQELQWEHYAKTHVADADVEKYYKDNKDFFDKILVRASHIVLRVPPNASEADKAKAKAQLAELRAQLVAGKLDFAEAAKKYSQCPSAGNGGDIGLFPRKFMVDEPFARAAFSMKVGDVSDVVQTSYGLHIIKVTERKPGEPSDYAKVKDDVREFCTEEMRQSILSEQRRAGKIEITLP